MVAPYATRLDSPRVHLLALRVTSSKFALVWIEFLTKRSQLSKRIA